MLPVFEKGGKTWNDKLLLTVNNNERSIFVLSLAGKKLLTNSVLANDNYDLRCTFRNNCLYTRRKRICYCGKLFFSGCML